MENLFTKDKPQIVTSNRVLYTASTFARSSLLHLQEIGELTALAPHTSSRSNLSSYLFFTVVSGSGELVYEGRTFPLTAGDCVFIDCHKPYSHTTDVDLWTLKWIHFYGPTMANIYGKYQERGGRPTFTPESDTFSSLWSSLFSLSTVQDYMRDMRINAELGNLLTLLMVESWHPEDALSASKKASVGDVKEYLDTHYTEHITLNDLATHFYINKYYLTRVFKEQFGMSITAYLHSVRITHAKQLLRFTDKTVEEIGLECGIGQLNYFGRVFKEVEGVPPSVYREQW